MELDLTGAACLVFQHGSSGRVNIIYPADGRQCRLGRSSRGSNHEASADPDGFSRAFLADIPIVQCF